MRDFARLFRALDETTSTSARTAALEAYFRAAPEKDRVWTIALLSGRRPKRAANSTELREWAAATAQMPAWLFEECYAQSGDLAETIALILPEPADAGPPAGLTETLTALAALPGQPADARRAVIEAAWARFGGEERFLFNKLLTGGFRMGVSRGLMTRALARATGMEEAALAHRLMGGWDPATTSFAALLEGTGGDARPYPFALASPLEAGPEVLGDPSDWVAEWKWDGIRGQMIQRPGAFALWSRGEELVTDRFPEFGPIADFLPQGTVLDGEILAWDQAAARPMAFAALQTRISRKTVPKACLRSAPARFLAYDLLELDSRDLRATPFEQRRLALKALLQGMPASLPLAASPMVSFAGWGALATTRQSARDHLAEGLMLKRRGSAYFGGRKRGDWWKWKLDPFSIDVVMLYAQAGHGRRAGLYTDFTFAVRDGETLVPVAKAYSGLTDGEFAEVTRWVQAHTLERFGPVRRVPPELVFELAFEGIQASPRHKSGIALRFPRMARWRRDKPVAEIDTLDALRRLLAEAGGAQPPRSPPRAPM